MNEDVISDRFRAMADAIEKDPGHFDMHDWAYKFGNKAPPSPLSVVKADESVKCGTTFCLAGWALALTPIEEFEEAAVRNRLDLDLYDDNYDHVWIEAGGLALDLDPEAAEALFMATSLSLESAVEILRILADLDSEERDAKEIYDLVERAAEGSL